VLIMNNPGFVIVFVGILLLVLALSTILFMLSLMFGAVFLACAANRFVLNRIASSLEKAPG